MTNEVPKLGCMLKACPMNRDGYCISSTKARYCQNRIRVGFETLIPEMIKGERYNWKNQKERLIYLGFNWSGNGYWHQFVLVEEPNKIWCEVLTNQLESFERTVTI